MTHDLKCWPEFFAPMKEGLKTFDYRRDDRGFDVGDLLRLREWHPRTKKYTGREVTLEVTFVVRSAPGLPEGYCIMQLRPSGAGLPASIRDAERTALAVREQVVEFKTETLAWRERIDAEVQALRRGLTCLAGENQRLKTELHESDVGGF